MTDSGVTSLVSAISDAAVAKLAAGGYPALTAGKILLGDEHIAEHATPPKIVFVPWRVNWSSKDPTGARPLLTNTPYDAEALAQLASRPVLTDEFTFRVHCWGTTDSRTDATTIPERDYDFTRALAHAVIAACHEVACGCYTAGPGEWTPGGVVRLGRELVFGLTFPTPVLSELLPFVPPGVVGEADVYLDDGDGTPELTAVIPL